MWTVDPQQQNSYEFIRIRGVENLKTAIRGSWALRTALGDRGTKERQFRGAGTKKQIETALYRIQGADGGG
jgi:hypothetical protein